MKKLLLPLAFFLSFGSDCIAHKGEGESDTGTLVSVPPAPPTLIAPSDGAVRSSENLSLEWHHSIHVSSYKVQVSETADFLTTSIDEIGTDTTLAVTELEANTSYFWRVCASNVAGDGAYSNTWEFATSMTSTSDLNDHFISGLPFATILSVYPNPSQDLSRISFHLTEELDISLSILNNAGQEVIRLFSGELRAGKHIFEWNGRNMQGAPVPAGSYYYVLNTGKGILSRKILITQH